MRVIMDVVYNHATGAHPYAAMYWDYDKTASNNPWFNVSAPHGWSVYHDWNHSNPMVRDHVKQSLEYLIREYKVDGFRFDMMVAILAGVLLLVCSLKGSLKRWAGILMLLSYVAYFAMIW